MTVNLYVSMRLKRFTYYVHVRIPTGWTVIVEYVKVLITSSVFNAQADRFHKIKTCLISRTRPNKLS